MILAEWTRRLGAELGWHAEAAPFPHFTGAVCGKEKGRFVGIVRPATKLDVCRRRFTARREWDDMMKLQEPALTTGAARAEERTAAMISSPDLALDRSRYVPRRRSGCA